MATPRRSLGTRTTPAPSDLGRGLGDYARLSAPCNILAHGTAPARPVLSRDAAASSLAAHGLVQSRRAVWYVRLRVAFSDALATVRRESWVP